MMCFSANTLGKLGHKGLLYGNIITITISESDSISSPIPMCIVVTRIQDYSLTSIYYKRLQFC